MVSVRSMSFIRALVLVASAAVSVLLAVGFSACIQIGPSNEEDGDGGTPTVQDQCSEVAAAFCSRANACYGADVNVCYPQMMAQCCSNDCSKPATSEEKAIRACVADIGKENCDDVVVQKLPDRCNGVVTYD